MVSSNSLVQIGTHFKDRTSPIYEQLASSTQAAVAERSKASDFFRSFGQVDLKGSGVKIFFPFPP